MQSSCVASELPFLESHRLRLIHRGRSSNGRAAYTSGHNLVGHLIEDILTADSEYMPQEPEIVGSSPTRAAAVAVTR